MKSNVWGHRKGEDSVRLTKKTREEKENRTGFWKDMRDEYIYILYINIYIPGTYVKFAAFDEPKVLNKEGIAGIALEKIKLMIRISKESRV